MTLYNVKELKELDTITEVNKFLENGWRLISYTDGKFIVGRFEFRSHT